MNFSLICPQCRKPLTGYTCATHGVYERDAGGFIRFLPKSADYFSAHWEHNQLPEIPASKLSIAKAFLAPLAGKLSQGRVLDVGAGDGVHLHHLKSAAPSLECAGLDISASGLSTCHRRCPDALLLQADAQAIPLADASVDAAFSYGVLAYLPNPWQGLKEMARVTKPGGFIGLWMYPRKSGLAGTLLGLTRMIVPRLPRFLQAHIADVIVPLLRFLPTASTVHLGNASWAACREVVLVNIAPPHLIFPTHDEVAAKMQALGCRIIADDASAPITLWAVKEAG